MTLTKKSVKEEIEQYLPSMPRYKRIKLITHLIPCYKRALEAASLLEEPKPNEPAPAYCDIYDDYLILKDEEGKSIADVYVGKDSSILNHIIFESGNELTEHTMWLLKGAELLDGEYIKECKCGRCADYRANLLLENDSDHLTRNSERVLTVKSIGALKITGVSEQLLERMRDSTIISETTSGPKIMGYFPIVREDS